MKTFLIAAGITAVIIIALRILTGPGGILEPASRAAGRKGEQYATKVIRTVLRDGDHLFTNVQITVDGKPAEMDNVVVNKYGVFIIEVKNYVGKLYGSEDDYEWSKVKTTNAGKTYGKTVKNPIKQVKRQTYILAKYLEHKGYRVWVEGRAILLHGNSPVKSPYVLGGVKDIDNTIHSSDKNNIDEKTVNKICKLLSD